MARPTTEIARYFKSHEFKRSLLMTVLMVGIGFSLYYSGNQVLIIPILIGIFLTSFSDLQGSFRHRTLAMFLSILLNVFLVISANLLFAYPLFFLLFLLTSVFLISLVSVYGNRASFFAFSGLLCIVLSFIRQFEGIEIVKYALLIALGGLIYLATSSLYHWLTRKTQTNQQLGELAGITSEYLKLRVEIAKSDITDNNVQAIQKELFDLQIQITEKQEALRELLLADRKISGQSVTRNRQMLILIELIDIMEIAIANQSTFSKVKMMLPNENDVLQPFISVAEAITKHMGFIAKMLLDRRTLSETNLIEERLNIAHAAIQEYLSKAEIHKARPAILLLRNLHNYFEEQSKKIRSIERLVTNVDHHRKLALTKNQQSKFLTKEDYSFSVLKENWSLKSTIVRHSLRLTIAFLIGFLVGKIFHLENAYWVLLTIVVIMRPSYGLTKERSVKRVIGTIIGVIIAIGIVQLTGNVYVYISLAAVSLILGVSLLNRNYIVAAAAITLNVIFMFSLIKSDQWSVIAFRLIDTVIGAVISLAIGYILFPNWEFKTIKSAIHSALESNRNYLNEISNFYSNSNDDTNYRLLRKQAFLDSSELNASFQRFMQDPKSKQKNYSTIYNLVILCQSMLSSMANLGSYIHSHHSNRLSSEFQIISGRIQEDISDIQRQLGDKEWKGHDISSEIYEKARSEIDNEWNALESIRNQEIEEGKLEIDQSFRLQLQEVKLVQEELNWLENLTENIKEAVQKL